MVDNFCRIFHKREKEKLPPSNKKRYREGNLSLAELSTEVVPKSWTEEAAK